MSSKPPRHAAASAAVLTALCLTSSPAVRAQNSTVPAVMNGVEGGSGTNVPFGSSQACRYQCIFDADELPWVGPRPISGFSIRADNGNPAAAGGAIAAKGFLVVSVLVSTTHASAATASGVFEDNHGEDVQRMITSQPIQLPAQPLVGPGPRPANVTFTFPSPWWYGLTPARPNQPAPANLLIEIVIQSQPPGSYPIDNLGGCLAPVTTFGNQGPLCTVPGLSPPALRSDPSMTAGAGFSWYVDHGPANAPFLLSFNVTNQGYFGGQPPYALPYPMFDPQNPSQPSAALAAVSVQWPAPDCWFNIDPVYSVFGVCDAAGAGVYPTQLPPGRGYVGFELFAQAMILSQTSNPLMTITTLGRSSTICGPLSVARVFAFYNGSGTPPPPPPASGAVQYGIAPVIEVF